MYIGAGGVFEVIYTERHRTWVRRRSIKDGSLTNPVERSSEKKFRQAT